ncbi:helix-turn-helix domain-containing protein [Aminipila terrae]|uniref:Helix-turn-helix domain-containing protein n=1 Tax=Aminipila terrae TaxID=2697030 RepID=A0A6P1MJ71_9FIRM|nr:helix-turn-helix transcriptional regulator [Aminipila terrae]QHI73967.1 helix-turn-helix domain-containing protein [Aminipila terrae]
MISYEPFWQTISDKKISTYNLIKKYGISSSTISRLKHNKGINTNTIDDLCTILECTVSDIIKHIPNK